MNSRKSRSPKKLRPLNTVPFSSVAWDKQLKHYKIGRVKKSKSRSLAQKSSWAISLSQPTIAKENSFFEQHYNLIAFDDLFEDFVWMSGGKFDNTAPILFIGLNEFWYYLTTNGERFTIGACKKLEDHIIVERKSRNNRARANHWTRERRRIVFENTIVSQKAGEAFWSNRALTYPHFIVISPDPQYPSGVGS